MKSEVTASASYLSAGSVLKQFSSLAVRRPDNVALVEGGQYITLGEIAAQANGISHKIASLVSAAAESPVALCTDSTREYIVGALGSWMSGCPYLPISSDVPRERIGHMLTESGAGVALAGSDRASKIPGGFLTVLEIDECVDSWQRTSQTGLATPFAPDLVPEQTAYIIYTSGSTGKPKGVAVTHGNLQNLVSWYRARFEVTERDKVTQLRSLGSDVCVMEIWPALVSGARIYSLDRMEHLIAEELKDFLIGEEITICEVPTLIAEELIGLAWPGSTELRYLQTGGETLRRYPAARLPFELINSYGPTECTVVTTSDSVAPSANGREQPTIGRPITGAEVFILDGELRILSDGEKGEIFAGGAGVAKGYVGRPDLTADRFVTLLIEGENRRLYRTGDIGRKLPSGQIEFCGRVDDQIKIRGYRVEPGEISRVLRAHPAISAAAVKSIGEDVHRELVAYIVSRESLSTQEIQSHLREKLPHYMVPELFVRMERLPLTANGKIDYASLPFPNRSILMEVQESSLEPATEIEIEVASILSRVLKQPTIGFRDNFFALGGNSLLAAQVAAAVQRSFGVDLPVRAIFESATVESLTRQIERRIAEITSTVVPA